METQMSKIHQIPEGRHAVEPWIISRDTPKLMAFLKRAFGAEEVACMAGEEGRVVHAEARIGDSSVLMFDAYPNWPDTPAFIRLYVEDCDVMYARALAAGAVSVTSPATHAFGERTARVRDPLGNVWWLQTHVEDVDEKTAAARAGERRYAEAMKDAEETLVREMSARAG
jgi:PhnB protein